MKNLAFYAKAILLGLAIGLVFIASWRAGEWLAYGFNHFFPSPTVIMNCPVNGGAQ